MGKISKYARILCKALNAYGVQCKLEPWDGHKHIDIRLFEARIDIEVDGDEHYTNPDIIRSDIKRRYWSSKERYITVHIPNHIIDKQLHYAVTAISEIADSRIKQIKPVSKIK